MLVLITECMWISTQSYYLTISYTSSNNIRIVHTRSSNNSSGHFYFNHLPRLWNALPSINLELPINFKSQLKSFLWNLTLILIIIVLTCSRGDPGSAIIFCAPVVLVCVPLMLDHDFGLPTCCWYAFSIHYSLGILYCVFLLVVLICVYYEVYNYSYNYN